MIQSKVLLEKEEYRFVEKGIIELNGKPDYRLQKKDYYTKRWNDIYLFDNQMQCLTAMEDFNYAKWLDPDRVPCYVKDYDDEDTESPAWFLISSKKISGEPKDPKEIDNSLLF